MSTELTFEQVKVIYNRHHDAFIEARKVLPNADRALSLDSGLSEDEADQFFTAESELYLSMVYAIDDELEDSNWNWQKYLDYETENYIESLTQMTDHDVIDLGEPSCQH